MEVSPDSSPQGPPHNPGVGKLIDGKRQWSAPPTPEAEQRGFRGWHERGFLPHRDEPGLTQFVTFRLGDAYPVALRAEWAALLEIEHDRERRRRLEAYLDRGHGECLLRRGDLANLVEQTLFFAQGRRYDLRAWVVMPNHVHVLFETLTVSMSEIVRAWKSCIAHKINRLLNRRGALWQEDYWDTYIRDAAHELKARRYIEANPVKAGLVREPRRWRWSSARHRDNYERLTVPM